MIDPATGWSEISQIHNKTAAEIADITEKTWFTRYPLPQWIVFDRGTKFIAKFARICQNDYGLKRKPITTRTTQSNSIIEQIDQTVGNIIRTFDMSNIVNNNPWSCILAATMFAVRKTHHTTLQASAMKLLFCQNAILNINHVADWKHIWQRKKLQINHNNKRENMHRNNQQYKVGDKILVKREKKFNPELEFMGPFPITQINKDLTVCSQKWIITS